jgi:hypothetical protein
MLEFEAFLRDMPLINAAILVGVSAFTWHAVKAVVEKYAGSRAESIAADVNLQNEIRRLVLSEDAKVTVGRLNQEMVLGAMKLLRLISEINITFFDWRFNMSGRAAELGSDEVLEDVGLKDLARVRSLLMQLTSEAEANIILLGKDPCTLVIHWVYHQHKGYTELEGLLHKLKSAHSDLGRLDVKRLTNFRAALKGLASEKNKKVPELLDQIRDALENKVKAGLVDMVDPPKIAPVSGRLRRAWGKVTGRAL